MTDYLKIKALRTFDAGFGLKTVDSEPFAVEAGHARELISLQLAEEIGEGEEPEASDPVEPISSARSTKKKEKTDADNEGS